MTLNYDSQAIDVSSIYTTSTLTNDATTSITAQKIQIDGATRTPIKDYTQLGYLTIRSETGISQTSLSVTNAFIQTKKGREAMPTSSIVLQFASAPECNPDITPPAVELLEPKATTGRVSVDTPFVFRLSDNNKGIDWSKTILTINGQSYTKGSPELQIRDDEVAVKPSRPLPHGTGIVVTLSTQDQQIYGGPNLTSQTFNFKTTLEPMACMQMGCQATYVSAPVTLTTTECQTLADQYKTSNNSLYKKLFETARCDEDIMSGTLAAAPKVSTPDFHHLDEQTPVNPDSNITLLAIVGWTLFFISFGLKIIYVVRAKYYRNKHHEHLQKYGING